MMAESESNPKADKPQSVSARAGGDTKPAQVRHILVIEDNKADVFLIREAIREAQLEVELHVVHDGDKAIRFLADAGSDGVPCPDLVILDINLPRKSGDEVLEQMRSMPKCAAAPVIVVTSSSSDQDRREMARLGADAYFSKSSEYDEFMQLGQVVSRLLPS